MDRDLWREHLGHLGWFVLIRSSSSLSVDAFCFETQSTTSDAEDDNSSQKNIDNQVAVLSTKRH